MKRFNLYLGMLGLTMLATGCNDEFDTPPMVVPTRLFHLKCLG